MSFFNFLGGNLPFIGGIFSDIHAANQAKSARQESMQFSREMYQRQFDDQYRLYKENREYSSPAQQMARLRQAGLNPSLMYKGGAGGAGNVSAMNAPGSHKPDFAISHLSSIANIANSIADYNYKKQLAGKTSEEKNNAYIAGLRLSHDLKSQPFLGAYTGKDDIYKLRDLNQRIKLAESQKAVHDAQRAKEDKEIREAMNRIVNNPLYKNSPFGMLLLKSFDFIK